MYSLLSYGEILVDFLPADSASFQYTPLAGGAPANVAVAFAKLGGNSFFAGGISTDNFGSFLNKALIKEGVNTKYTVSFKNTNTAIVLVSLDDCGERSFNFYRQASADTKFNEEHINKIDWDDINIFHFCSNTMTDELMFSSTQYTIDKAKEKNTFISFDVNLRQQLWRDIDQLSTRVDKGLGKSDLVKLSKDEAIYLAKQKQMSIQNYLDYILTLGDKLIIITNGSDDIQVKSAHFSSFIQVPTIQAIDTTAAGDSFIAGFLYALTQVSVRDNHLKISSAGILKNSLLDIKIVTKAVLFAAKCGAFTCQKKGAFEALPALKDL